MARKIFIPLLLVMVFGLASVSHGAEPKDVLQTEIDRFIGVLKDPALRAPGAKEQQNQKIWAILHKIFDFEGVARRAVGRNWNKFSKAEGKEFVAVFTEILGENYLKKIQEGYTDEKVVFLEQDKPTDNKAVVKTKIVRANTEIPVDYSMWLRGGTWRIYDVNIEGVSLVRNYRSQFDEILRREAPAALIQRLKKKVEDERKG